MEFCVLGQLAVHDEGEPVALGPPVQRRLLAVLLCRADRAVPTGELCDLLWSGAPPPAARKTLQVHVHRLRQALGPERIRHEAAGYRLVVHAGELDSVRFTGLVGQAHAARRALDLLAAHELLESALDLWRGEPYSDVEDVEPVAEEVRRLTDQRLLAIEDLAGLRLDLKRHSEVLPELRHLVRANPYRERLRALLLLALYRCGRRTEALEEFRATRSLLRDELGLEPGPTLQRLHEAVLRGDEQLADVMSSSLDGTWEPVPVSGPAVPRQLPFVAAGFTGRQRERKELDELLGLGEGTAGVPLAVVTGTAGVGKPNPEF